MIHLFLFSEHAEFTCGDSIYPHIDALQVSTGIKYVTVEDSCCGSLRVTVETYCSRISRPGSGECHARR